MAKTNLSKHFITRQVNKYLANYEIKELITFLVDNNLEYDSHVEDIFDNKMGCYSEDFINIFDSNWKVKDDREIYNLILYSPKTIPYVLSVDNTVLDRAPENIGKFLRFAAKEVDEGRVNDLLVVNEITESGFETKLDRVFDGNYYTPYVYQCMVKNIQGMYNYRKLSARFKSGFTPFEIKLLKIMNRIDNQVHISNKKNRAYYMVSDFLLYCKREQIPQFVKLVPGIARRYVDLDISEEFIKKIFFSTSYKYDLFGYHFDELEKIAGDAISKFPEAHKKLFILNNKHLNEAFEFLGFSYEDLDDLIYLKEDKIYVNPKILPLLFSAKRFENLISIAAEFVEEDKLNEITFDDDVLGQSIKELGKVYNELLQLDNGLVDRYLLDNLNKDRNFLSLPPEKIQKLSVLLIELCKRVEGSNTKELKKHGGEILQLLLENCDEDKYIEALDKIEDVFENSTLPIVAKKFSIYKVLNPDLEEKDFSKNRAISPTIKKINKERRYTLIFTDLMRISFSNNNVELRHYLKNLYYGKCLYEKVLDNRIDIESLPIYEKDVLNDFLGQLCSLYNNTRDGEKESYKLTGDTLTDLNNLAPLFKPTDDYSLIDRIIRMYGILAGFTSFEQACEYMNQKVVEADERGRRISKEKFSLEQGDMIKGIGEEKYLYDILQNGSLCKEFLGADLSSDATPLDTDLSLILKKKGSMSKTVEDTMAAGYGPIWFVIKKGKYEMTRTEVGVDTGYTRGPECFTTLSEGHVGIRTGFPSTEIDYIITYEKNNKQNVEKIKFDIALNGIYIPLVDIDSEKLLFTPEEYDMMRDKMDGLSYYGCDDFDISENLNVPTDYDNKDLIEDARFKKDNINAFISKVMKDKFNYDFISKLSRNVEVGHVQLIDTGSTGRGTNVSKDTDFDFIMRVDEAADRTEISKAICESLGLDYEEAREKEMVIGGGNLRLKDVSIPNLDQKVSIDITFMSKADNLSYTTDMALADRLDSIRRQHPDKYEDVLDNIIYAKQFLKKANAYKPSHARDSNDGGLGGVGIENWVLQNGGSFYDACMSFVGAATDERGRLRSFQDFKNDYNVFDFGENFYNGRHDEFVDNNMTEEGYKRMYKAISAYLSLNKNTNKQRIRNNTNEIPIDLESIKGMSR